MTTFKTKGPRMLYLTRLRQRIRFDADGMFHTEDKALIAALSNHRRVIKVSKESSDVIQSKDDPSTTATTTRPAMPGISPSNPVERDEAVTDDDDDNAERGGKAADERGGEDEADGDDDDDDDRDGAADDPTKPKSPIIARDFSRGDLEAMAKAEGLDPSEYGNKQALVTAINKAYGL